MSRLLCQFGNLVTVSEIHLKDKGKYCIFREERTDFVIKNSSIEVTSTGFLNISEVDRKHEHSMVYAFPT